MHLPFLTIRSNLVRRSPRSALPTRPTVERLEDRCVPSADFMPGMGMPMMGMGFMPMQQVGLGFMPGQQMTTDPMQMQQMGTDPMPVQPMTMAPVPVQPMGTSTAVASTAATNTAAMNTPNITLSPAALAALNQLFADFNRTMLQVMSSRNLQQFVANETAMLRIITGDLLHLMATQSPATQGG